MSMIKHDKIFINGEWVTPSSSETIEVENPANKEIIGSVPACKEEDVNRAVEAAKEAFKTWQYTPLDERIKLTKKLVDELRLRVDDMTDIIVKELGAPTEYARETHVLPYLDDIENFIKIMGDYPLEETFDGYSVVREPIGVVGALTPWNFPFGQITKKLAPALLSGSTIVIKPSQNTPLVSYILAEAVEKVGFPAGVFNLVPGKGSDVGNPLAQHPDVNLITFTGSTDGGREVSKLAYDDIKRVTLELGGKSPVIILKDADLDVALFNVLNSIYSNTGQACSAFSRLLVPREDKEKIEKMIVDRTKSYIFGDPTDPETRMGPLASKKQFFKVKYYIERGIQEGAKVLLGGVPEESDGYYVDPVVFTDVDNDMEIAREEIFGPVLSIIPYDTVEEAIEMANDNKYGLMSAVFGPNDEVLDVARQIKAGGVVVNDGTRTHAAPFGGYKHSGVGREGGKYGLDEFFQIKTLYI